jgi:hypothetical protein
MVPGSHSAAEDVGHHSAAEDTEGADLHQLRVLRALTSILLRVLRALTSILLRILGAMLILTLVPLVRRSLVPLLVT